MTDLKTPQSVVIENNGSTELVSSKKTDTFYPNIAFMLYMAALAFWFFQIYTTF